MGEHLLVHEGTFALLLDGGEIQGRGGRSPDGLFRRDARHLSRWQLTLDGAEPVVLALGGDGSHSSTVLTPTGERDQPPAYTVFREQEVHGGALFERLRLVANGPDELTVRLELAVDADFADQFELRGDTAFSKPGGERHGHRTDTGVEFHYRRGDWHSRTDVTARPASDSTDDGDDGDDVMPAGTDVGEAGTRAVAKRLAWTLTVPGHGSTMLELCVRAHPHGAEVAPVTAARRGPEGTGDTEPADGATENGSPEQADGSLNLGHGSLEHGSGSLDRACAQGAADLESLRITAGGPDGEQLRPPAAGIPWFLTLFGRDALLTSLFALPYRTDLADATLLALAATQARHPDPARVAQPGKIVHEVRHGELAHFGQVPYGSYYGSVDSTPLFLVLLSARTERTGDGALARRLEHPARDAVRWLFEDGGLDEHGWLVYAADEGGLANQNWKDSPGAVCTSDGWQAEGTIAVAEAQGYAYDALRRTARIARTVWADPDYARRLEAAATALRARVLRDFWLADQDFPALALDATGRVCDALASDAGHLLWSGLLDQERGTLVGRRLLEPDFFSGWGIRTLAAGQGAYHPLSYHRGSVWPHDNAVIALGLARYGLRDQVRTLTDGLLGTAARHGYRLPEVLAGYGRDTHPEPVPYPHACSPQAWAAATPLALRTALATSRHG